jgi:hypothetical protein
MSQSKQELIKAKLRWFFKVGVPVAWPVTRIETDGRTTWSNTWTGTWSK